MLAALRRQFSFLYLCFDDVFCFSMNVDVFCDVSCVFFRFSPIHLEFFHSIHRQPLRLWTKVSLVLLVFLSWLDPHS